MNDERSQRYDGYDAFYAQRNEGFLQRRDRRLRDYARKYGAVLPTDRGARLLDLGCANGALVDFLKEQGFADVVGIDISEPLIEQARANVDAEFFCGDAQVLLAEMRPFDAIFLLNVLEHIEPDAVVGFARIVHAALKPGGFAVVRVPNMNNVLAAGHLADDITHRTGFTEQGLGQLAQIAGFAKVEMIRQFPMQTPRGKVKAVLNTLLHRYLFWLRGGTEPRVFYRNLYAKLIT